MRDIISAFIVGPLVLPPQYDPPNSDEPTPIPFHLVQEFRGTDGGKRVLRLHKLHRTI